MVDKGRQSRRVVAGGSAGVLCALVLAGCGGGLSVRDVLPTGSESLSPGDFRAAGAEQAPERPIPLYVPERARAPRVAIRSVTEAEARGGVEGIDTRVGEPALEQPGQIVPPPGQEEAAPAPEPIDPGGMTLVDAKIGDLNGVPILARNWLEPMGSRLRAESAGKTRAQWRAFAAETINQELIFDLRDELYLAEARSTLTAQQKAGLRVFLKRFEKDVVRGSYGSQTLADEQLRASSGRGLDEALRERERMALIQTQVRQKVWDRVQVSQRDLALEYEKNYETYNPPPRAVFRLIRVSTSDATAIEEIGAAVGSKPFGELAEDDRNTRKEEAVVELKGTYEQTEFFGIEALQEAALSLTPGQTAGPIEAGPFTYWLHLDRIDAESRTLYQAQRELRDQITSERRREEERRYLLRLFERAGISNVDELVMQLVDVAERWYYEGGAG